MATDDEAGRGAGHGTGHGTGHDAEHDAEELLAGRYLLGDVLGSGGMGKVWQAEDRLLGRQVAVKELRAAQALTAADLANLNSRMKQEARAAARVNHPGVVTVHDVFEHDGRPWIVMELVEGRSLADVIDEEGTLLPRDAAKVGGKVLEALRAAHDAGVLHRDVKPGNVLLSRDGRVLLTDFGIATLEGGTALTRTGDLVGSPDYLAPERAVGRRPGPESDLWSLGATLFAAVEGQSPFRRTSALSTLQAVVTEEMPEPRHAGALAPVLEALLRKDPHERPSHDDTARLLLDVAEGRAVAPAGGGNGGNGRQYAPTQMSTQPPPPPPPVHTPMPPPVHTPPPYAMPQPTPYPPQTPPASYPAPGPAPATGGGDGKGRWLLVAAVALLAALIGGGVALAVLNNKDEGGGKKAGSSSSPSPERVTRSSEPQGQSKSPAPKDTASDDSTDDSTDQPADVPPGYHRVTDPAGFSMAVPDGWTRQETDGQIDYTPDGGKHLLRFGTIPSATGSAYDHFLELEQVVGKFTSYSRLRLAENTFKGRPGAVWEFTWTAKEAPAGPRHGIDQGYVADDGTEYDMYAASPADDWGTTQRHFQTMLDTWELTR